MANKSEISVQLSELKPHPKNAKLHPPEQIEKIAESIRRYGYIQPIVVDGENNIVMGHGRYEAMRSIYTDDQYIDVVQVTDLSEAEITALRIFDNKIAETEWDYPFLAADIESLIDVIGRAETEQLTGFTEEEISEFNSMIPEDLQDPQPEPEKKEKIQSEEIDGYQQISFTLMVKDMDLVKEVLALFDTNKNTAIVKCAHKILSLSQKTIENITNKEDIDG
jgi:ParB-like chromosome segregation protein Spo0J